MSYLSELDPSGWQQRNAEDLLQGAPAEEKPGFFSGLIKGPVEGLGRGLTNLNDALLTGTDLIYPMSDEERGQQEHIRRKLTDFFTPDARTVGAAGRVLGGAAEGLAPLLVPGAGVPLMVGSNTLAAGKRAVDQGVDADTAGGIAALEGAASYAGLKVPILGGTLGRRLATGAAGNLALGAGSAEAQHALLNSRGYEEMAKNYDPLDVEARSVDLLSGLVFGGLHHLALPSEKAAVATLNNAKHFQQDTAPGTPADTIATAEHVRAMETATEQLVRGEPVNVPDSVTQATFTPRTGEGNPIPDDLKELDAAQRELIDKSAAQEQAGGYDVAEGVLTDEQREAFANLGRTGDGSVARAGSADVLPGADRRGSSPAGETTVDVFRGSNADLAGEHFGDEALGFASEHPSAGSGVWFTASAEEAARYGSKVSGHQLTFKKLKEYDAGEFPAFDSLDEARAFKRKLIAEGYDGIHLKNSQVGGADHYVAFSPEAITKPKATPAAKPKTAEPAAPAGKAAEAEDPVTASVRESLLAADVRVPTGARDTDGNYVTRSARELLAEADAETAAAQETGKGIAAAVSCFLTRGA